MNFINPAESKTILGNVEELIRGIDDEIKRLE
jgi:hypothetical protein